MREHRTHELIINAFDQVYCSECGVAGYELYKPCREVISRRAILAMRLSGYLNFTIMLWVWLLHTTRDVGMTMCAVLIGLSGVGWIYLAKYLEGGGQ